MSRSWRSTSKNTLNKPARTFSWLTLSRQLGYTPDTPELSAAVLDHGLKKDDTSEICTILKDRHLPFVLYSGSTNVHGDCADGELVHKPAPPHILVTTLAGVLGELRRPALD
jgi:hypothetical protein